MSDTGWTDWDDLPEWYRQAVREADKAIMGQRITNEINRDPKEVAKLRRSVDQAKQGNRRPYRAVTDDGESPHR